MSQENLNIAEKASNSEADPAKQSGVEQAAGSDPAKQPSPEGKENETPAPEDKKGEGEAKTDQDEPQGAPEKYEFSFDEGTEVHTEVLSEFETLAREHNLTQEQAQKFVGLAPKLANAIMQTQISKFENTMSEWAEQAKTDKEIGGTAMDSKLSVAVTALEKFASPELRQMLEKFDVEKNPTGTGFGQHPEIIRLFYRIGQAISEDSVTRGKEPASTAVSAAERLYGNNTKK